MATPTQWPDADCVEALRLHDAGLAWAQIGPMFGRSKSAAQAAVRRYQGKKPRTSYNCGTGPAIGLEQTEMGFRRDCYQGSLSLQRAIESLFARMPERRVMAILCPAPARIPGTERIYRGQGAERALAA